MKHESKPYDHKGKKAEHMAHRHAHHGSLRKVADEFGVSKSTAHRIVSRHNQDVCDDD